MRCWEKDFSMLLTQIAKFFSYSAIETYAEELGIRPDTVHSHFYRSRKGKPIPVDSAGIYIQVFRRALSNPSPRLFSKVPEDKMPLMVNIFLPTLVDLLEEIYAITNPVTSRIDNFVTTLIYDIKNAENYITTLSPTFSYKLNKYFDVFADMSNIELNFLIFLVKNPRREAVISELLKLERLPPEQIEEIKSQQNQRYSWYTLRENYLTTGIGSNPVINWKIFTTKVEKFLKQDWDEKVDFVRRAIHIVALLQLLMPKNGESDMPLGFREINSFITFKFELTESSKKQILRYLQL